MTRPMKQASVHSGIEKPRNVQSIAPHSPEPRSTRPVIDYAGAVLLVDEAHAVGVYGARGTGACEEAGLHPSAVITMNPAGKALGVSGSFVARSRTSSMLKKNENGVRMSPRASRIPHGVRRQLK